MTFQNEILGGIKLMGIKICSVKSLKRSESMSFFISLFQEGAFGFREPPLPLLLWYLPHHFTASTLPRLCHNSRLLPLQLPPLHCHISSVRVRSRSVQHPRCRSAFALRLRAGQIPHRRAQSQPSSEGRGGHDSGVKEKEKQLLLLCFFSFLLVSKHRQSQKEQQQLSPDAAGFGRGSGGDDAWQEEGTRRGRAVD